LKVSACRTQRERERESHRASERDMHRDIWINIERERDRERKRERERWLAHAGHDSRTEAVGTGSRISFARGSRWYWPARERKEEKGE
jgi:hypothetical protein